MSKHPTNQISEGSRWRNKKSGVVSEVLRVEGRDVVLRAGRKGERRKLAAHFALDYEPAGDAEVRVRRPGESPEDTEIRLLRAKIAELETALKTAEQQRDEARANYAFMVERAADQRLDGYRELGAKAAAAEERAEKAERERDEARAEVATLLANADADAHTISRMGRELAAARAERDARPAITPDDCAIRDEYIRAPDDKIRPYMTGAVARIDVALSAHGKKARIYPCEKCGKMRSEDEGGAEFRYCDTCRVVAKAAKP